MGNESRPLHFLKEEVFRKWLNDLYVGLVSSTENCELIAKTRPEDYDFSKIHGNDLTKECMRNACLWLQWIRPFIKDEKTYHSQFLRPAQIAAEFLLRIRKQKPTTSIKGWIFSKSEPYGDSRYDTERITVSMVVPSLKTTMSLRLRTEESVGVGYGMHEFGEIQPIPLINRLHQFHPKIKKINETLSLNELDFLKVSFDDFEKFSDSIEMSNFSEVDSVQTGLRHHLGSTFVVPCIIKKTRQPRITVQSSISNSTKTMLMSDHLLKSFDYEFLDSLRNKPALMLAIQWYDPSGDKESRNTEVMYIEKTDNLSNLKQDEIVGFVRMRNAVAVETMKTKFGMQDLSSISSLVSENGVVKFRILERSDDFVVDEFLKSVDTLRGIRSLSRQDEFIQLNYFDVVDKEKITTLGMANLVKKDETMLRIIQTILKNFDFKGEFPSVSDICAIIVIDEDVAKRKISWMVNLGIVERHEGKIRLTPKGKKVAFASMKQRIKEEIKSKGSGLISLPDFQTNYPISLISEFLKNPESGYFPIILKGEKSKLFWTSEHSDDRQKIFQEKFDFMKSELLLAISKTNYPFTSLKALEEMSKLDSGTNFFTVQEIIKYLAREKILVPSGESWEFTLEERIRFLFQENPDNVYSLDGVIATLSIPLMQKPKVENILHDLKNKGILSNLPLGAWTLKGNDEDKSEKIIRETLSRKTYRLLKSRKNGLDKKILESMMNKMAYDMCKENKFFDRKKLVSSTLKKLEEDNIVFIREGIYRIRSA